MGGSVEYRVYLDGKPADEKFYKMLETVTVEQSMDMATEARLEVELCADENGNWSSRTGATLEAWKRVRIEVKNMTDEWVPLIDGPMVSWAATTRSEPGQSMTTMVVNDDTSLLNTEVEPFTYDNTTDERIIRELLKPLDERADVDTFPARPPDIRLDIRRSCTRMELLLELTRPFARHVYVRPGIKAGMSLAFVKKFCPASTVKLPALTLNGPGRNIDSFDVTVRATAAAHVTASRLDKDRVTGKKKTAGPDEVQRIGNEDPFGQNASQPKKSLMLEPGIAQFYDPDALTQERAEAESFSLVAKGSLRAGTYAGVLLVYDQVNTGGAPAALCTTWMIRDVTHTLGRSEYRQDFTLLANAVASDVRKNLPPKGTF